MIGSDDDQKFNSRVARSWLPPVLLSDNPFSIMPSLAKGSIPKYDMFYANLHYNIGKVAALQISDKGVDDAYRIFFLNYVSAESFARRLKAHKIGNKLENSEELEHRVVSLIHFFLDIYVENPVSNIREVDKLLTNFRLDLPALAAETQQLYDLGYLSL